MTSKPVKKLHIVTHGCQMNEYDSARMGDLLGESHQMIATDDPGEADVILLNTCSIREKAQEKVFHQLGRWKHLKESNPDLVIGVGGCVAPLLVHRVLSFGLKKLVNFSPFGPAIDEERKLVVGSL